MIILTEYPKGNVEGDCAQSENGNINMYNHWPKFGNVFKENIIYN